ncbi:hypothetical protein JCM24511_03850 [Saitozyma sp. JCM 24511]|nr:hypothetical protein JCM24511_03850 [Saitozyma sp. JCM 24511]
MAIPALPTPSAPAFAIPSHPHAAPARRTSSLRDPLPDATPPGGSRASSMSADEDEEGDEFMAHQTRGSRRRKGKSRGER